MSQRRGNGEGSISKRSDGRWQGQISIGRDKTTGKLKRVTYYGKTRKIVSDKIKEALAEYQKGRFIEKSMVLFNDYLDQWLKGKKVSISVNTYAKYDILSEKHIRDTIGKYTLQQLTRADIQNLITEKSQVLAPKTVAEIYMIIKNVMALALDDGIIPRNVCHKIQLPTIKPPEIKILTEEEITIVLQACMGKAIYDPIFLSYSTGLRRGEVLGLSYDDIDFNNNTININKSWVFVKGIPQWSDTATGTKTAAGKRIIAVPDAAMDMLRKRKESHPNDTYVCQCSSGMPMSPNNYTRDLKKYIKRKVAEINAKRIKEDPEADLVNDINISPHDLRHNFATKLIALNVHDRLIQEQLGHKDLRATRRYTHAVLEDQQKAIALLNTHLEKINQ